MDFQEAKEFAKEFKKLKEKYQTLENDFLVLKKAILTNPKGDGSKHWNRLKFAGETDVSIFKVRMMCRAVRGSQFRVVYAYRENIVEVLFIEIYFKGKKEGEDEKRVQEYFELLK